MNFFGTIVLLAGLISAILLPYFIGHGLVTGDTTAMLIGIGGAVLSAVLIAAHTRVVTPADTDDDARAGGHG